VYRTGSVGAQRRLVWVDRTGREVAPAGDLDSAVPLNVALSPDGRRAALNRTVGANTDIWLLDVSRSVLIRFTFDPAPDIAPVWSPDGTRILYAGLTSAVGGFQLFEQSLNGTDSRRPIAPMPLSCIPLDWSRDDEFVLFRCLDPKSGWDLWACPVHGDGKPFPVAQTPFDERTAQFSPDAKWIAYESNESGRFEIYVQRFHGGGAKSRVSNAGGSQVRWSADGAEIFFVAADGALVSVPARVRPADGDLELGSPVPLFMTRVESGVQGGIVHTYAVTRDRQRFVMSTFTEQPASPLTLILNRPTR
jgi:eukaryotic-like serine/threonine-protein kinase